MEALRPGDPEKIGGYECVGRLGAGGMGEVFLARAGDGGLVALKLIHADLAEDAAFRARFAREAAAVRRVSGPYTAPLLDSGDVPRPWLATAYLPGLSLEQAVTRHGPLSVEATRRLGAALAEALGAIHRAGVVHRDLKPANILLTADGPRVVDFGIAGGPDFSTGDGTAGRPVGTPAYMAPEQLTGGSVTPAADVFALGGVLVFCRTGSPPFGTAPPPKPLDRVVRGRPVLDDADDAGLREVVAACLAEGSARRPSTEQLVTMLSPGATGTGWLPGPMAHEIADQATSIPPSTQGPRPRRRVLLRISGVGAAALAGMGVVRALGGAAPPAASVLWAARATVVTGYEFGPALPGRLFLLDRTVVTRSGGARLDLCCLDTTTGRYRWRRPLTPFERERGEVVAGPGGVWVRSNRELHAIDPDSGTVRWSQRRAFPGLVPAAAYGENLVYDVGPFAVSDGAGSVYAHEPRTGRVVWERRIDGRPVGTLVVARGVLYVISASARGRWERVHALDAATGAVRWVSGLADEDVVSAPPFAPRYTDATLSVADDTVYVSVEGRHVHALDARTGSARWRVRPQLNVDAVLGLPYPSAALPVAAGNRLFLGTGDGVLRAFDTRDGRRRWAVDTGVPPAPVGVFRRRFTPVVGHGLVFVRGADSVRALRAEDGDVRWELRTDPSAGEPVLAGGTLHVPGKWEVTSHDPVSGRVVQRLDLRDHHRSPTAVLAGRDALYVLAGVDAVIAVGLPG
ncbi:serine/threonine-protein kinase [Actinomadura alba]|uniref:Serine/threonine-protein kinase n=1 Tax=Actinomadura alba TaxID=406431 RepID=A0ABR7LSB9_9ACTN|nr:serine/threonine-protein kinase [Actinomadura alba]MBC6467489.1 serine/threonine-protein kinase [Actinomadura alba]